MRRVATALPALVLAACTAPTLPAGPGGGDGGGIATTGPTASTTSGEAPGVTYQGRVRGLLETHCTPCHGPEGTAARWLNAPEIVPANADDVVSRVESGEMPPYRPRDGCRDVVGVPVFPSEAIAALVAWRELGFPEGDPAEYAGPAPLPSDPRPPLGAATMSLSMPEAFTPVAGSGDTVEEYLVDPGLAEDAWVVATELRPSAPRVVHHAAAFVELEGAPPPEVPAPASIVGAWAPGYAPLRFPEGSAMLLPAGAKVRLLIHYSVIGLGPSEPVPSDTTALLLWTLPAGVLPASQAFLDPISQSDLFVPAFDADVEVSGERALGLEGAAIVGVVPHMHLLGKAFHAEVAHADGSTSCLVDVPAYDFNHQALYVFAAGEEVAVAPGDVHRMTCTYDNSVANQPLVNGAPKVPVDVTWGDASTDEMCQNALLRLAPLP